MYPCVADPRVDDNTTPVLLVLYEVEARVRLGDNQVDAVLERALALPQSEPKAFETIAGW